MQHQGTIHYIILELCSLDCHLTTFHVQIFPNCNPSHTNNCRNGYAQNVTGTWAMYKTIEHMLNFVGGEISISVMNAARNGRVRINLRITGRRYTI